MSANSPGRGAPPPGTVKIRLEGSPEDLAVAAAMLLEAFGSAECYLEARLYQNLEDPGLPAVRRAGNWTSSRAASVGHDGRRRAAPGAGATLARRVPRFQDRFGYDIIPVTGQRSSAAGLPTARVTMMAWRVPELRSTVARRVRADLGRGASAHQAGSLT